jgi:hypothetical protein
VVVDPDMMSLDRAYSCNDGAWPCDSGQAECSAVIEPYCAALYKGLVR